MTVDHFLDRAAEIDIDNLGTAVGIDLGGFAHCVRLATSELDRHGLFFGAALNHCHRLAALADHCLAGDHLRHHEGGAQALDKAAKRQIGNTRHRRQDHRLIDDCETEINAHFLSIISICLSIKQSLSFFLLRRNINQRLRHKTPAVAKPKRFD